MKTWCIANSCGQKEKSPCGSEKVMFSRKEDMISVEQVSEIRELVRYEREWKDLVSGLAGASIFDTYEWVTAWLDCFWRNKPISFLFFRKEGSLVGIAPLLADRCGDIWCAHTFISPVNLHGNRANVICAENPAAVLEALLAYLGRERKRFRLAFPNALSTIPLASFLPEIAARHDMLTIVFPGIASPIIRIRGDWQSYLKSRSTHLAKEMRRKLKLLERAGRAEVLTVTSVDQCSEAMQDILHIEKCSWKEQAGISLSAMPHLAEFHQRFAEEAARRGWLRLYLLHLDSKPIAYVYGVVFQNEFYAFKTAYNHDYQKLSPGIVLFEHVFHDAFDQGLETVDLGLGDESRWKSELANDLREHVNVCVFNRLSLRCRCCRLYQQIIKPFIKQRMPFIVRLKKRLAAFGSRSHEG